MSFVVRVMRLGTANRLSCSELKSITWPNTFSRTV